MADKVLNKGFDLYSHKYSFSIKKIEEFMNNYFNPIKRDMVCLGGGWERMPDFINDTMVKISPKLFAKNIIYACKKR